MMKYKLVVETILSFLLLTFFLTGCQTNTYTHKQFPERVARIHNVGLVPQVHTAILNTYYGKDPSPARFPDEEQIRSELTRSTVAQLQQRGFIVAEIPCPGLTNLLYPELVQQAQSLARDGQLDGVIILNVNAYKSTLHRQRITSPENTISFLLTVASIACLQPTDFPYESWQAAAVDIALIDGNNGEILWRTGKDFDDFNRNKPSKDVEELFSQYPETGTMKGTGCEK